MDTIKFLHLTEAKPLENMPLTIQNLVGLPAMTDKNFWIDLDNAGAAKIHRENIICGFKYQDQVYLVSIPSDIDK